MFDSSTRGASIVASKGSSEGANVGSVILYRLAGKQFRKKLGEDELQSLQDHMKDAIKVRPGSVLVSCAVLVLPPFRPPFLIP